MKRAVSALVVIVVSLAMWATYVIEGRASLTPYSALAFTPAQRQPAGLRVTFFGVGSLLFDDGQTAILSDGFFTRPGYLRFYLSMALPTISPDRDLIRRYLQRANIRRLAAVIPTHSHYDHVMDAPEIAQQTGAMLVGSESTANVGRGWGLPADRIRVIRGGEPMQFGRFRVTMVPSRHSPTPFASLLGNITAAVRPPARATAYKDGGTFSLVIEHDGKTLIVQPSANYVNGALQNYHADVVFLGISPGPSAAMYSEVVHATGARRVIPIHWDDYRRPLTEPLVPMLPILPLRRAPPLASGFDRAMNVLLESARADGVDVKLLYAWMPVDPFDGL